MIPDRLIRLLKAQYHFSIQPYDIANQQPCSYDVHLGREAKYWTFPAGPDDYIDLGDPDRLPRMASTTINDRETLPMFFIQPGEIILGVTIEHIVLGGRFAAKLDGKSTLGRAGLLVHVTAGLIDPGWEGRITVELMNLSPFPIRLWWGMPIGQLEFYDLGMEVDRRYGSSELGSRYNNAHTVEESKGLCPITEIPESSDSSSATSTEARSNSQDDPSQPSNTLTSGPRPKIQTSAEIFRQRRRLLRLNDSGVEHPSDPTGSQ